MSRAASAQNASRIAPPALVLVMVAAGAGIHGSLPVQQDDAPRFCCFHCMINIVILHARFCKPRRTRRGRQGIRKSKKKQMPDRNCVVIVGAGPVGLVSAVCLARSGIPSVLLEASPTTPRDLRASTVHPPTLDMLDEIGVADDYIKLGVTTDMLAGDPSRHPRAGGVRPVRDQGPHAAPLPAAMRAVQPLADPVRAGARPPAWSTSISASR